MEIPRALLYVLASIGAVVCLAVAGRTIDFLLFHFTTPTQPLEAYRRGDGGPKPTYALITGASAGIGYGIARSLVKHGFGVILLGHKEDELAQAAASLRALVPEDHTRRHHRRAGQEDALRLVRTIVMDAQAATPQEMEDALRTTVTDEDLRVSVLVNNVGSNPIALPAWRGLRTYAPADVDAVIDLNARFMARLTAVMLPVLMRRGAGVDEHGRASGGTHRRSLILNVSSGGHIGLPWLVVYGATKGFNLSFSRGLARELETDPETRHIDSLCVVPWDVKSQGNTLGVTKGAPDSEAYGKYIVERVDGAVNRGWREMSPYWLHHLQWLLLGWLPERYWKDAMVDKLKIKRDAFNDVFKAKDE
ncbi:hypothetical protein VPNG_04961 [Cytospora leucostoma]|uniref:Uncharacterized protein n=1 Tax=Cytospora leucostoma TaxID=1230097 RepID=A0A423X7D6_9PEZI|nr:hypothetical protein VPNG_04961 [Cytospora leucostoma]